MNAYQEMPKEKNDRRDEVKTLLTNLRNYHMRLVVYRNIYKRPELDSNELSEKVEFIKHFIANWENLIVKNNMDEFLQNEFLKVVYDTIKLELITTIYNSELLEFIINHDFKLRMFRNMIKEDITEIKSSTFANLEFIDYLTRALEVKDILSNEVIRIIIMCNDYEKIREGNSIYLDNQNKKLNSELSNVKTRVKREITHIKDNIRELRKKLIKQLIKRTIVPSILAFIILLGGVGIKYAIDNMVQDNAVEKFNTTYTTYSSIGSKEEETKYEEVLLEDSVIMTIYNKPYLVDGSLFRTVKTYEIDGFDEASLEEYFSIDFSNIPIKPLKEETIELTSSDTLEEYREVTLTTQDKEDVEKTIKELKLSDYAFGIGGALFVPISLAILFSIKTCSFDTKEINKTKEQLEKEIEIWKRELNKLIKDLESMYPKIFESSKICEEIVGYEDFSELKEKYKQVIEESNRINEEQAFLLADLESEIANKLIKKYKRK